MKTNEFRTVIDQSDLSRILPVMAKVLAEVNPELSIRKETLKYRSLISIQFDLNDEQVAFLEGISRAGIAFKDNGVVQGR